VPVLASSANRPGQIPPATASAAVSNVGDVAAYAVDGGEARLRAASTIVSIRGNAWSIRRPGILDERTIRRLARSEILMVCTGNTCRSPMAAYMFRKQLADRLGLGYDELENAGYAVVSAGTASGRGGPIASGSREELANRGIDASDHRTQPLTFESVQQAERIYVMSPEHRLAVVDLAAGAAGKTELLDPDRPIEDPIGGGPEAYRSAAEQIERAVTRRVEEFLHDDRDW
jgi:protein-tyrosine-phosphatase